MAFDTTGGHRQVRDTLDLVAGVGEGMRRLLVYCAKLQPWKGLDAIAALDFEADEKALRAWLANVLSNEPPTQWIRALWFGLVKEALPDGKDACRLYVSGSTEFDRHDETFDWASAPEYFPDRRHAPSRVLAAICQSLASAGPDARELGEYVLCLGYAALTVRSICKSIDRKLLAGEEGPRHVAVGFDSGGGLVIL